MTDSIVENPKRTPAQQATVDRLHSRNARLADLPQFKVKANADGSRVTVALAEIEDPVLADARLYQAFGGVAKRIMERLMGQMAPAFSNNDAERAKFINDVVSSIDTIGPQDGSEAFLAAHMVTAHETAMTCMARASLEGQTFEGRELNLRYALKFQRLYLEQMNALRKHRNGGQQKVTVEHVHVHDGGQAIVGNVGPGVGGRRKNEEQPHET